MEGILFHHLVDASSALVSPDSFDPLLLSPNLWLDASDAATITEVGGAVSQWDDKSGNGRHVAQTSATLQPTTNSRNLNGLNLIDFNSDRLTRADSCGIVGTTAFHIFMVGIPDALVATNTLYRAALSFGASGSGASINYSWSLPAVFHANGNSYAITQTADGVNGVFSSYSRPAGGSHSSNVFYENGDLLTHTQVTNSTAVLNLGSSITNIGSAFDGTLGESVGSIGEVLIFNVVLDDANRQKVEGYLAHKWGLTSVLPVDHPYVTSMPTA